jgi:hypothetical protein
VTSDEMVKIRLLGPHKGDSETLWAKRIAPGRYRLDNGPFFGGWRTLPRGTGVNPCTIETRGVAGGRPFPTGRVANPPARQRSEPLHD